MEQSKPFTDCTMEGRILSDERFNGNSSDDMGLLNDNVLSPEEKILLKRQLNCIRTAQKRALESPQERESRLHKNRLRNRLKRASETREERATRNRKNMERNRLRRLKDRAFNPDIPSTLIVDILEDSSSQSLPSEAPTTIQKSDQE